MDIVFMGTPDFAVPCLKALVESGENVKAVFTQPDKPKGRGYKLAPPPVKEYAVSKNIPVYQPVSMKKGEEADKSYELLKELAPDLIVVVAYGQILTRRVLDLPKTYCINIHASLLPKYRGAGPIQWCILNGEKVTGVTSMIMADGIDTGDMLLKATLEIGENETADELHDRLSELGAKVLLDTVSAIKSGDVHPEKQDDSLSNYAPRLTKELCPIDFSKSAQEIHDQIRGLSSWPCAVAEIAGRRLKIYRSELDGVHHSGSAGEICDKDKFTVICGDGFGITFTEVQAEGGKRMKTADYLRGNKL
ncbi:methionyl-tRNA formyltransferase [Huintestinicola sp.]|uniref:methionyl-tRNA formyltransferase n=1 Tax=Huintestinicola sp. TaxID=2981661 RepID=UPI003D7E7686